MSACLPEQLDSTASAAGKACRCRWATSASIDQCPPQPRADSGTPAFARIERAPDTCSVSPLWLPVPRASSEAESPKASAAPPCTPTSACSGLLEER